MRRITAHGACRTALLIGSFLGAAASPGGTPQAQSGLSLNGYYKNFSVVYLLPDYQRQLLGVPDSPKGLVSNRLRVNARYASSMGVAVHLSYNLLPRIQDPVFLVAADAFGGAAPRIYRLDDLDPQLYPGDDAPRTSFAVFQNLDRAYISFRLADVDARVGRQPLAWGAARVLNPTDIVAPFLYTELDTEDRGGVDAVRLRKPLGALSELDVGFVAGNDLAADENAYYARGRFYTLRSDISVIGAAFREHLMLGCDWTRGLGGAGAWLEAAYVWIDAFSGADRGTGPNYLRLSTGLDYRFPGDLYGYVEYHFNGAGVSHPADYLDARLSTPARDAAVYLVGRHYLAPGLSYPLTPLWLSNINLLVNIGDPSVLMAPGIEFNMAEDVYLQAGAFIGLGTAPRIAPAVPFGPPQVDFRSEFGAYEDLVYLSFRCYF